MNDKAIYQYYNKNYGNVVSLSLKISYGASLMPFPS